MVCLTVVMIVQVRLAIMRLMTEVVLSQLKRLRVLNWKSISKWIFQKLRTQYYPEIEEVADFMNQYTDVIVELEGHTDSDGIEDYNQGLSERRANAVRDVLVGRFNIQGSRVTAVGYGESQPIATNNTAAGKAQNRRVITVIIKTLQEYQPR
jgi:OOP family OmpA-OmpF porin